MKLRIATWNVNSIKVRAPAVVAWLERAGVDVLLLQELKCECAAFPAAPFEALGYHCLVLGQKTYNGVAVLSRLPVTEVLRGLPGGPVIPASVMCDPMPAAVPACAGRQGTLSPDTPCQRPEGLWKPVTGDVSDSTLADIAPDLDTGADEQARYLEVELGAAGGGLGGFGRLRIASLYLPNGNPVDSAKYPYKLSWMRRLAARAAQLLAEERAFVLGGDFNIIPEPVDVYDPVAWREDALFRLESRRAYRALVHLGLVDAWRAVRPAWLGGEPGYTFWDYQAGRWPRNEGLRIDHFLLSPAAADALRGCRVDPAPRAGERPSDHTPLVLDLDLDQALVRA